MDPHVIHCQTATRRKLLWHSIALMIAKAIIKDVDTERIETQAVGAYRKYVRARLVVNSCHVVVSVSALTIFDCHPHYLNC